MASEYERIRRQCLKRGELWEDTEFPTTQTSIFYHQSPPFQFVWKRPKELATNPVFIREGTSVLDVVPGKLGDRWLVSTLGCLFLTKGFFYRVVPADQGFDTALDGTNSSTGYCGAFRFRVWWCGEWVEVTVDDRLPTVNGRLVFAHCLNSGQFWPCLLEKAYAKLHGSYEALKYGTTLDGLADLTGGVTESLSVVGGGHINKDTSFHVRLLARLLANTSILTAVAHRPTTTTGTIQQQQQQQPNSLTSPQPNNKENNNNNNSLSSCNSSSTTTSNGLTTTKEQSLQQQQQSSRSVTDRLPIGILVGINYKICAVDKVDTLTEESVPLLRLRCPYGRHGESTGDWSRGDAKNWETSVSVSAAERERLGPDQLPDGEFYLSFPDFIATFTAIECVHLDAETSRDEPTLQGRVAWITRVYQGCWQRGVTAGGCRNNSETFHINPQLHLIVSDADEVVISLNQHSVLEPKVIGFSVYPLPKLTGSDLINRAFFKKTKSLVNSQYTNSRQVSQRSQLDQGGYLIVPTTFEAGHEGSFTLRVYSTQAIKLKLVDMLPCQMKPTLIRAPPVINGYSTQTTDGKNVAQYEAVFLQLADEHRTVNAFELHELLEACLPNDYIKSCANLDVCRQLVLVFDVSGLGRLKLTDFRDFMASLKQWQTAFKSHTKEKTGILRAERFRDALHDVGFQVNNDVLSALILRHMRKDGTLRFGDFVSAVLHLTVAFGTFDKRDPLQNGSVKLTLTEWLKYALMC
ncbi:calpain-C-like [Daphnia pulicaria]|uniref:calpain-C-like n=1 Tax=Daphnia pulicaria TaxID=35523 RepID=UPI001EEAD0F5|nr:calpain-C-like [Daphnia pulicaria]